MARSKAPKQERSRELVSAVLVATVDLLRGAGDSLSMRGIADRAGVGVASIYDYFRDREQVLDAVVDHVTRTNFDRLRASFEAHEAQPIEAALDAFLDQVFALYLDQGFLTRSLVRSIFRFGQAEHIVAERDRFVEIITLRLARELPGVDRAVVSDAAITVTDMIFGIILAEIHRAPEPRRSAAAREAGKRLLATELARLRERASEAGAARGQLKSILGG